MKRPPGQLRLWTLFLVLSLAVHILVLFPVGVPGSYNFTMPVSQLQAVMVELESKQTTVSSPVMGPPPPVGIQESVKQAQSIVEEVPAEVAPEADTERTELKPQADVGVEEKIPPPVIDQLSIVGELETERRLMPSPVLQPPLRVAGEFLVTARETLIYQISMYGVPAGNAQLEARNEHGDIKIALMVKSNALLSSVYPVDDLIETRHIGGNFIITKIRQQEGSFLSNQGFTLFLRDKKVFWHNLLTHRSSNETIPTNDVLDLLSGFYFLRGKQLQVGTTQILQIYDSDQFTEIPVQVLRREQVQLPGLRKAETIVIKPLLKTDGIFRRTGEILIWLTDDENKVPVRVETHIALGTVTAELLSAEAE